MMTLHAVECVKEPMYYYYNFQFPHANDVKCIAYYVTHYNSHSIQMWVSQPHARKQLPPSEFNNTSVYLHHTIKIQSMPARLLIKRCRHVFGGSAVNVVPAAGFLFIATTPPSSDISLISHSLNNVYDQALVLWIYSLPWPTLTSPSSDDITPGRDQLTGLVDGGLFTLFELCVRMCDHMSKDDHDDGRRGTIQMLIYSKNKAIF